MKPATRITRVEPCPGDPFGASSPPIYQTATFRQASALEFGAYDYSRSGNPTRDVLERHLATLEGGAGACAVTSGMAAIGAAVRLVPAGGRIVAGDDLYGGTFRLLARIAAPAGLRVEFVDLADTGVAADALRAGADLVLVETPTNPRQRVVDLRALSRLSRAAGALLAVDNTMMSPYLQRPIALGADLVVHSATKYLAGHADVTAGAVVSADPGLADRLAFNQNAEGTALAPMESWLLLRGLRTLALRLDRQQASARRIADHLARHPAVRHTFFVGLPSHPQHALHASQADGPGAVVSFTTGSVERSRRAVESLRLFDIAVSFGSIHSTASLPCRMSHASIPPGVRHDQGLPEDLVRLSIGIEDPDDLVADLDHALRTACAPTPTPRPTRSEPQPA